MVLKIWDRIITLASGGYRNVGSLYEGLSYLIRRENFITFRALASHVYHTGLAYHTPRASIILLKIKKRV